MQMSRSSAIRVVSTDAGNTPAPQLRQRAHGSVAVVAEISAGLLAAKPYTSPKYLYDGLGSKLFEAICELPEYYPTRTEAGIFAEHGAAMAQAIGTGTTLVDLGAGNCAKAASLFPLLQPAQYVPVDISRDFLTEAVNPFAAAFPGHRDDGAGAGLLQRLRAAG